MGSQDQRSLRSSSHVRSSVGRCAATCLSESARGRGDFIACLCRARRSQRPPSLASARRQATLAAMPDPSPMTLALAEAEAAGGARRGAGRRGAARSGRHGPGAGRQSGRGAGRSDRACRASGAARRPARTLGRPRLVDCDLYVTLEPCPMCAQAISFARIRRLYYGAADPKGGGVDHGPRIFASSSCHHAPEVYGGIGERRAAALLKAFFRAAASWPATFREIGEVSTKAEHREAAPGSGSQTSQPACRGRQRRRRRDPDRAPSSRSGSSPARSRCWAR